MIIVPISTHDTSCTCFHFKSRNLHFSDNRASRWDLPNSCPVLSKGKSIDAKNDHDNRARVADKKPKRERDVYSLCSVSFPAPLIKKPSVLSFPSRLAARLAEMLS